MNLTKFTEAYKKVLTESTDDSKLRKLVRDIVEEVRNKHLEEDYKTSEKRFLDAGADPEEVKKILAFHRDNKNTFKPNLKDIDAQKDWKEFQKEIIPLMKQKEVKQEFKTQDQVTLRDDNEWLIIVPLNHGTSCFHGSDTDWCTTKQDQSQFSKYFYEANIILVYCIKKNQNKDKWAIALHIDKLNKTEFFNKRNISINKVTFKKQTSLSFDVILDGIKKNLDYINQKRVLNSKTDLFYLLKKAKGLGKPDPNLEAQIIAQKSGVAAYQYAAEVLRGPFPKGEELIAKDPELAYKYATDVLKGPFPKGEETIEGTIAKDPVRAHKYAKDILKGAFPKGEDAIAKDPELAYDYATLVLKGPFPKGEKIIAKHPGLAYGYAKDALKSPWPEVEELIAKYSDWAYKYAADVLGGPFPKGENAIAKDPNWAYRYAKDVLGGPFPKGEDAIAKHPAFAYIYALNVLKRPWPKAEKTIATDPNPNWAYKYAQDVLKLKDPESWPDNL